MQYALDNDTDRTEELDESLETSSAERAAFSSTPADVVQVAEGAVLRDRYLLDVLLADSGRSLVYAGRDLRRDATDAFEVAIKILGERQRHSPAAVARLKREFRQTQVLRHPGVVRMLDLDCDRDTWFITMERLEGVSLKARLAWESHGTLNTAEAIRIGYACSDVLDHAHQLGLVHGDFKPGNVFIEANGNVRVLDFGSAPDAATATSESAANRDAIPRVATRTYASTEVLGGLTPTPRDDVFSFACVLYEMLAGHHPFDRVPSNEARDAALDAAPLPQLSAAQNAALSRGLAWTRAERPASTHVLMQSILNADGPVAVEPEPALPDPPILAPRRKLGWPVWLGVGALIVAALWIVFFAGEDNDEVATVVAEEPAPPTPVVEPPKPIVRETVAAPPPVMPAAEAPAAVEPAPAPVVARPKVRIDADSVSVHVAEGAPSAVILLNRTGDKSVPVQVAWRLTDGSAVVGKDYGAPKKGVVKLLAGQTSRALYIPLLSDQEQEGPESFTVSLSSSSATLGKNRKITVTIDDDD